MTQLDFEEYLAGGALPPSGEAIVRRAWAATGPSRRIRSNRAHGSARLASTKTGASRDAESFLEYRVYKLFEQRHEVRWYLAQPPDQVLREFVTVTEDGAIRSSKSWSSADAFVLWADRAPGWVEVKPRSAIDAKIAAHPDLYVAAAGGWRCPTGEAFAAQFGLTYSVIADEDLNPTEVANADYLRDFFGIEPQPGVVSALRTRVAREPGVTVARLRDAGFAVDQVCAAILEGEIYLDLTRYQLRQQHLAFVYLNATVAGEMPAPVVVSVGGSRPMAVHVEAGEQVLWRGQRWVITEAGPATVSLAPSEPGGEAISLPRADLERAVRSAAMTGLGPLDAERRAALELLEERFAHAADADVECACERLECLRAYWAGERTTFPPVDGKVPSLAAVRDWQTRYRRMEELGAGLAGLIDLPREGRPGSHLAQPVQELIAAVAESFYDTPGRLASAAALYRLVAARAGEVGIVAPSYNAVLNWTKDRPRYATERRRRGHKGAATIKPWAPFDPQAAPPNGQYPGHVAHGDATTADIWCVERFTRLGEVRPRIWRLVDGMTGKRLGRAWHLGEVDEGVVLEAIADQIRTFGFLSQVYVLDSALVHKTTRLQRFLKRHGSDLVYRQTSDGRGGLPVERDFGRLNTDALHQFRGNTQISRDPRAMDRELDPRLHAVWPLGELVAAVDAHDVLMERERVIPALQMTTEQAWATRLEHGQRENRRLRWSDALERELGVVDPYQPRVSAKDGIWVNRLYYWNDSFMRPALEKVKVKVITLRWDIGSVWAFVPGHTHDGEGQPGTWVRCALRSPIARVQVTYEELSFFTKVMLGFNKGHHGRKKVEAGRLGEYLLEMLEREAKLLGERDTIRAANGLGPRDVADLQRGDVLVDAPEPASTARRPDLSLIGGGAGLPARPTVVRRPAAAPIAFGSRVRRREDDFLASLPGPTDAQDHEGPRP